MTRHLSVVIGALLAWSPLARADGPASTPPLPGGPVENDLNRANHKPVRVDGRDVPAGQQPGAKRSATTAPAGTAPDDQPIRAAIGHLADVIVGPDHLDQLTQRLAQPDRDRIRGGETYRQGYGPALDTAAKQFGDAWRAKYGHPFTADAATAAIGPGFADVTQGADVVGNPKAAAVGGRFAQAMAAVAVHAAHGLPAITVPLVREQPEGWKVDGPDAMSAETLRGQLVNAVTAIVVGKAEWPAD